MERPPRQDPIIELLGMLQDRVGDDSFRPAMDVYETEKALVVLMELAGVRREDVRITVDGDRLRIRGTRGPARDAEAQRLHQVEIATGPFERVLRVRIGFEREQVSARLEDGILRVVLPKRAPVRRRIRVGSEGEGPTSEGPE